MYTMMFCIAVGVAWISILFLEICIINPYIKYVKYPRMRKMGYIIEDGYLQGKHPERYVPLGTYMNGCILKFFNIHYKYLYNKLIQVL